MECFRGPITGSASNRCDVYARSMTARFIRQGTRGHRPRLQKTMTAAFQDFMAPANPEIETERRRACRALLRSPLLLAAGETAEEYILVRRHSEWLKHWFSRFPAWSLELDK